MIYQTINFSMFCDSFRSVRPDNFSYEGLRILYDHILELAEIANSPIELDVIALCCEYTEGTAEEVIEAYNVPVDPDSDKLATATEWLVDNWALVGVTDSGMIVYSPF